MRGEDMVGTVIEELTCSYLAEHPDFKYPPSGDKHPSVLALTDDIRPWITERLGGTVAFWNAMLDGAAVWFAEGSSRERWLFCWRIEADAATFWLDNPDFQHISEKYLSWRRATNKR